MPWPSTSTPAAPEPRSGPAASSTSRTSSSSTPPRCDADVAAAVDELRSAEGGAPERLYTVGFCIGGRISLLQARSGLGLSGVIGLYPWPVGPHRSGLPAPADEAPRFGCPVLVIYGGTDAGIPAEAREAFDRALDAAGVEHRTIVYEDAPHSFFDRKADDFADASAGAWRRDARLHGSRRHLALDRVDRDARRRRMDDDPRPELDRRARRGRRLQLEPARAAQDVVHLRAVEDATDDGEHGLG